APVVDVDVEGAPPALAAIHARLFTRTSSGGSVDPSSTSGVVFARTPDDVREPAECVRVVMRAALEGTPLDRIAIVLPDGAERGPLEQALDDAGIPATWFVGGPARELMPARLLRVAIDVAVGDATPLRLYELLGHPALDLRRVLGPDAVKGRGRWRRLLSSIRGARGLTRIVRGLEALPAPDGAPEELERERAARTSLLASLGALLPALEGLDVRAPLGAHVRALSRFVERFARRSEARSRLLALLEPYGRSRSGPHLSLSSMRTELDAILANELPRGALTERSVRVLSPMHLVGAELDVVCLLGLTEGRFPTERREDALLPDHLLAALSTTVGRTLSSSRAHDDVERRRFAAVAGATRRSLWLSSPALDFETERPALPSSLALAALSACLGRRTTYGELAKHQVRAGSRARVFTDRPDEALGEAEHLLARVHRDPAALAAVLATHPTSRGLLQLHTSMKRVADGGPLDAWTGLVPRDVLSAPGLDGAPVRLGVLEAMIDAPATLFFRHMLDAWAPARLEPWGPPLGPPALAARVADAAHGDPITEPAVTDVILTRVEAALTDALELGAFNPEELDEARPIVRALSASLVEAAEGYLRASPEDPAELKLTDDLPWTLAELRGRRVVDAAGTALVDVVLRQKNKTKVADEQRALALSALALERAGAALDAIAVVRPDGGGGREELAKFVDVLLDALRTGTTRTAAGVFPMAGDHTFALGGDAAAGDEDEDEEEDAA
ncbi:hypothetical protein L6R52_20270, partial [Myxococcota bacterium]|nr:hypothetical protein [Myxococcota bacterium]